ncbi:hypothetical protein VIGAN_03225700 [Vigna angularis var. angularis]|uniref:Uncharacterized protein n=1 Tax=Vigna angularis var. angularis TaxID=157739 RepID=A0A0S3RP13_PHAAN|nr:hypothetical protein VIGAN_03225700 [Vigna angularis var. angularis]
MPFTPVGAVLATASSKQTTANCFWSLSFSSHRRPSHSCHHFLRRRQAPNTAGTLSALEAVLAVGGKPQIHSQPRRRQPWKPPLMDPPILYFLFSIFMFGF